MTGRGRRTQGRSIRGARLASAPAEMFQDGHLTPAGWPRPIVEGWPIPWVSPSRSLSEMSPTRIEQIHHERLCQVCGEGHEDGSTVFLVCNGLMDGTVVEADITNKTVMGMDHGVLHRRCLTLAIAMCPLLKRLKAGGNLVIVATRAAAVAIFHRNDDPEAPQVGVVGCDVIWVGWSLDGAPA